ncbi:hypothetical protein [Polynucleobacter sp. Tro8-14-1]|uniref:hypothetical protein n=1 Tax=Polynucleobacter sp. Tro8-14-1 TaxID=1758383 RepID=UPI001C0CD3CD|nr:hypothetical protein [Polynucleobacter sp. Tro8-14-1]MBU3563623.1 hypothetical protein [Polynucleobacter sp. Tro8-14-1]
MKSPVLFLIFNRPDTTLKVFEAIRRAKPPRLYIVADGPRENIPGEIGKCIEARKIVGDIDWECKVKTLFRDENLGCKYGVSKGINWFFENEEEGIILEDDCLPQKDFFIFCDLMLEKYRDNFSVGTITGINLFGQNVGSNCYYFSRYQSIWGWASWRSRWEGYEVDIENRKKIEKIDINCEYPNHFRRHIDFCLDLVDAGLNNTWDYQLQYLIIKNNYLCIRPYANLISNIGPDGVHSYGNHKNIFHQYGNINIQNIEYNNNIISNKQEDYKYWDKYKTSYRIEFLRIVLLKINLYRVTKLLIDRLRYLRKYKL